MPCAVSEPFLPVDRTLVASYPIPADPDGMNLPGVTDIVQRVSIQYEKVGPFARLDRSNLGIDFRDARRAAGRRDDHLHRGHPGLHHHLHLDVLEVTLPSAWIALSPAIGAHGDRDTRIREDFQITIRLCERRLDRLSLFIVADLLLICREDELVDFTAI